MSESHIPSAIAQSEADILAAANRHLMNTYRRPAIVFTHGRGCYIYDAQGRAYLDFLGGIAVNALGYAHPRIVRVMRREAGRATHFSNLFHNQFQGPLAAKLAQWSGMDRCFFTNSGSEAVEGALKLARAAARGSDGDAGGKTRILALENSFHGRTLGALSLTHTEKYRAPFQPLMPGVEFVRLNDVADLEAKLDDRVCALFIEPTQGEGGIHGVSADFWQRARALATQHGAALIADEIQCGLGRTGRYFAYQKFGGREMWPDIVTIAKPLAAGLPLGAILAREKFAAAFHPGLHGSTFGGGPLACATALEFLSIVDEEGMLENVRLRGEEIRAGLEKLARKFKFIRKVRGEGLMIGVELDIDGAPIVEEAFRQGVIINCTHERVLRLLPPFTVRSSQVKQFLRKLKKILESVSARANSSATQQPAEQPFTSIAHEHTARS
jgi:predicted acetylornithine/succinylornithine family transaminase